MSAIRVEFVNGCAGPGIERVVVDQLAQAAAAVIDVAEHPVDLCDRAVQIVIELFVVDQLSHRTLLIFHRAHDAIEAGDQNVYVLQGGLRGAHYVLNVRHFLGWQFGVVGDHRPLGLRGVDVDKGFAQYAGGGEQYLRIGVEERLKLGVHLHDDFDRGAGAVRGMMIDDADALDVADIDALQAHRRAIAQPARIVDVGNNVQRRGKQAGGTAHQEDEEGQNDCGEDNGQSHPKLSPAKLLLTRHGFSNRN